MNSNSNLLLMSYNKYFPEENMYLIRQKFEEIDDDKVSILYSMSFKDPIIALVLSLVGGYLGIDRFYIGDTLLGVLKLITCGGLGLWTLIDYFLIMKSTKEKNFQKLVAFM